MKKIFVLVLRDQWASNPIAALPNELIAEEVEMFDNTFFIEEVPLFDDVQECVEWLRTDWSKKN